MMNNRHSLTVGVIMQLFCSVAPSYAAIALDRTRVVMDGRQKSVSLPVSNENRQLPYLAQAWIEDPQGNKITDVLTALPPIQRIEPGARSQVRIQSLPALDKLPQDRETLYYFNLREIPPRTDKSNALQLALQTRIKLFYRPAPIAEKRTAVPWQEKLTLKRNGDIWRVTNPTPYYITLSEATVRPGGPAVTAFKPVMVSPFSEEKLGSGASLLGNSPVLTYINDYGGRPKLKFSCKGDICTASPVKQG